MEIDVPPCVLDRLTLDLYECKHFQMSRTALDPKLSDPQAP
jgi:hypothetical protein